LREFSASTGAATATDGMGQNHDYWQARLTPCFKFIAKSAEEQLRSDAEEEREL
jgi:hypothetical protein